MNGQLNSGGMDATNSLDAVNRMDQRIVRSLETKPEVGIAADFAARVAGQVPARSRVAVTPARYGWMAMRVGIAVLLAALVVVAMRSAGHSVVGMALEWILCGQVAALSLWLGGWKVLGAPEV